MQINSQQLSELFSQDKLDAILPPDRSDQFFDALYGDTEEGAYDIQLVFKSFQDTRLQFELELRQRPGKCLVCNLTYGLPTVFERHPIIDIKGMVQKISALLEGQGQAQCSGWQLGRTREVSPQLHVIPLAVDLVD